MTPQDICNRLDEERRTLARDGEVVEVLPQLTRVRGLDGDWHAVRICSLSSEDAESIISEQLAYHRRLGVEFEWTVCRHDRPADLCHRLARHGFEIGEREAILVLNLAERPAWMESAASHAITRVEDSEQLRLYAQVSEEVFGSKHTFVVNQLARSLAAASKQQVGYLATENGRPVAVGRLETHPQSIFAGLYGGGTVASHRRRGFYRAIVAARARDAVELGARYLIVDARATSRPILERLGFLHLTDSWPCTWRP